MLNWINANEMVSNHHVHVQRDAVPLAGTFELMNTNFHSMESGARK